MTVFSLRSIDNFVVLFSKYSGGDSANIAGWLDQVVDAALVREMTIKEKATMVECFKLDRHREQKTYSSRQRSPMRHSFVTPAANATCFACARSGHDFRADTEILSAEFVTQLAM